MVNGMQVTIETPQDGVTATVTGGLIGNAQVDPDGVVNIRFFPTEAPPEETNNTPAIGDQMRYYQILVTDPWNGLKVKSNRSVQKKFSSWWMMRRKLRLS